MNKENMVAKTQSLVMLKKVTKTPTPNVLDSEKDTEKVNENEKKTTHTSCRCYL